MFRSAGNGSYEEIVNVREDKGVLIIISVIMTKGKRCENKKVRKSKKTEYIYCNVFLCSYCCNQTSRDHYHHQYRLYFLSFRICLCSCMYPRMYVCTVFVIVCA